MIKQPLRRKALYWSVTVFFIIYSLTLIFPFLWAFLGAMRDKQEYIENFLGLPTKFDLSNFGKAFKEFKVFDSDFMDMLITSIVFTACGTFMQVGSSLLTAYTIAKYNFKLRSFLYGLAVFIMIIPIVGSTPSMYKLVVDLGINDDPVGISLLYAGGFGMNFIILHGYIKGISWTYAEAAFVDGATDFEVFTKIMIPQTVPALVAIGVTSAISMWNDYLTPFLYLENTPTLAYGIYQFEQTIRQEYNYPVLYAGVLLTAIPVLIIYTAFQKTIMENMSVGGIKG